MIFDSIVTKNATAVCKESKTFIDEHPVASCVIACMAAVIFAQHVELKCYQIMTTVR